MTTQIYTRVRDILKAPDWEPVSVTDHGAFLTIAGCFRGIMHSGHTDRRGDRKDWRGLSIDLDRIAREDYAKIVEEPVLAAPVPDADLGAIEMLSTTGIVANTAPDPTADLLARISELESDNARLREASSREGGEDDLFDTDVVIAPEAKLAPAELQGLMFEGETIKQAKLRLYPLLEDELTKLKNQEALFGKSIPRRAEVEALIGILARVGEM